MSTAIGEVVVNGTLFYAPTAFTPDGDGLNDVWSPVARGVARYQARIWNRWGELVWSSQDAEKNPGWVNPRAGPILPQTASTCGK